MFDESTRSNSTKPDGFKRPTLFTGATFAIATVVPPASNAVPGPLPLFGAAAAFGWSRRLRSRIASSRPHHLN
jgi:MYXO-CTERM domain-containing protein